MTEHPLPSWNREYSNLIDEEIKKLVNSAEINLSRKIFYPLIQSATSMGRKLRSTLALRYVDWQGFPKDEYYQHLLSGLATIELLHSASCIIDDIIDGDIVRRGIASFVGLSLLCEVV
ncbi:MAG: polyprenyl synthetase family protein, partial [Nanoarchaeota archaeon]